ncbi:coenzyme F420-0:L-glutamate ligase [uncultured Phycicoccus sp.]|uniref:coenzyme F420-0:L-glutamate ligase n=1 Tax=uncultured Phycicoccus sp. TaxID=661422 RepID=UPI00262E0ECA|nr:coenzyme F420-0:L-glutamate ligase [uncultured Phycicoccus sp.]
MTEPATPAVQVLALHGLPEVRPGDDLAALLADALERDGLALRPGDCLVVSSKVVSKAAGLTWAGERAGAVAHHTRRVVAERRGTGGVTRVVESVAGPVMAAAGVDASNTGPGGETLLLPDDPDAEAAALRAAVLERAGRTADTAVGVVLSDTAGRPWRDGLTDFALGSAGLVVLEDLRGGTDHDGRPLAVTARAVADEVAAAADLVKGKADGVPAALVRGLPAAWFASDADGARSLVRVGRGDWFASGHVEALRAALGVGAGTRDSEELGIRSVAPEPLGERVGRVVALALHDVPDGSADVAVADDHAEVVLAAADPYDLGRLVVRTEVAAASEDLRAEHTARSVGAVTLRLT